MYCCSTRTEYCCSSCRVLIILSYLRTAVTAAAVVSWSSTASVYSVMSFHTAVLPTSYTYYCTWIMYWLYFVLQGYCSFSFFLCCGTNGKWGPQIATRRTEYGVHPPPTCACLVYHTTSTADCCCSDIAGPLQRCRCCCIRLLYLVHNIRSTKYK